MTRPGRMAIAGCAMVVIAATWASAHPAAPASGATAPRAVAACTPADLSATLLLTPVGGSSSSLAGAVIFSDTSPKACSLHGGIPKVGVVSPTGQALAAPQVPVVTRHLPPVKLPRSGATALRPDAGISITWSNWLCAKDSFALTVRFPGWKAAMTVPWGSTTGYAGAACAGEDAALYVSPVARVTAPA
jgi:hypothetical protein